MPMEHHLPQILLVGAEGVSETEGEAWIREATKEEAETFWLDKDTDLDIDHNGRPYWLMAILPTAPAEIYDRTAKCVRAVRL